MERDRLIGWLCMIYFSLDREEKAAFWLPDAVGEQLRALGWLERDPEPDWEGSHPAALTPAGRAIYDLHAAEWGIDRLSALG